MSALSGAFDELASRRVVLFGGKGGVGKTTVSAAAAIHFAKTRKTILFTTDPASSLSDLFSTNNQQPTTDNLTIEALDANALYTRFLEQHLNNFIEIGDRGTYLDRDELRRFFELSLPGVDEIMAWMRIGELADTNTDGVVVVDTAPTGHTVRMLDAAEHFAHFGVALDAMQEKHRGMVRQLMRREVRDAIDAFIDQFRQDAERRRLLLTDAARTAFVPVMLSEPWVVEQTIRLSNEVRSDGLNVPFTVLNRAIVDADCERCRKRAAADADARKRFERVIDAARACFPLDSVEAIEKWI